MDKKNQMLDSWIYIFICLFIKFFVKANEYIKKSF